MNFFKKYFSKKDETKSEASSLEGIVTKEYFNQRYTEDNVDEGMLDGCLKMVESYFLDNKIERKIKTPINHPVNLDQVDQDGFGFVLYCKSFSAWRRTGSTFSSFRFQRLSY